MQARCGIEECDCEYTIGGLLLRLEIIAEQCTTTVKRIRSACTDTDLHPCHHGSECPCYQEGAESEHRPVGA